MAEESPYGDPI